MIEADRPSPHRTWRQPAGPAVRCVLLGEFRVTVENATVDTGASRRTRAVLAFLLTRRRSVSRDVLMETFWPEARPEAARNNLHVALSGVRTVLRAAWPEPLLVRVGDAYRIAESARVWSDVEEFEHCCAAGIAARTDTDAARHLEAACQLYLDDFLTDEPYLEWAAPVRDRLRLAVLHARTRLMELYMARSLYGPAGVLGRLILAGDPANEQVNGNLMRCFAETGQRHLALAQFDRLVDALWSMFRVRTLAATVELRDRLRRSDWTPSTPHLPAMPHLAGMSAAGG